VITTLGGLRGLRNLPAIRSALDSLCGPSRLLRSYEFLHQTEKRVTLLVELNFAPADSDIREVGAYGFGNKLCLDLPLGERVAGYQAAAA
jgi:hypothetical protein